MYTEVVARKLRSDTRWDELGPLAKIVSALSVGLGGVSLALALWAVFRGYYFSFGGDFNIDGIRFPRPMNTFLGLVTMTSLAGIMVSAITWRFFHRPRGRWGLIMSSLAFIAMIMVPTFIG